MKCCQAKRCDVAMIGGKAKICLGVRCFNTSSCEIVPATEGENDLQIAHLTQRTMGNLTVG